MTWLFCLAERATKSLDHKWQEDQALPPGPARFFSLIKLVLMGIVQGEAGCMGSSWHRANFEGDADFGVHGRVLLASPDRHQKISLAPVVTRSF